MILLLSYTGPITVEILGILYLNLASLIYIGSQWALQERLWNQLDFFDEYWICILSFHLVYFSDWTIKHDEIKNTKDIESIVQKNENGCQTITTFFEDNSLTIVNMELNTNFGWFFIAIMCVNIAVKVIFIISENLHHLKMLFFQEQIWVNP